MSHHSSYFQDHLDAALYGSYPPSTEVACDMLGRIALFENSPKRKRGTALLSRRFPALEIYLMFQRSRRIADKTYYRKRIKPGGLLDYLGAYLSWSRVAGDDLEKADNNNDKNDEKSAGSTAQTSPQPTTSSLDIGRTVDAQITKLANNETPDAPLELYTEWFARYCYHRGWVVCGTQVPIWFETTPGSGIYVRTAIDVICYDVVSNQYVVLELKTGYDHDYRKPLRGTSKVDCTESSDRPDSYYFRHQYQLVWMYEQVYKDLRVNDVDPQAYVIVINKTHGVCKPMPIDPAASRYYREFYTPALVQERLLSTSNSNLPPIE